MLAWLWQIFQPQLLGNESIHGLAPTGSGNWFLESGYSALVIATNIKYDTGFYLVCTDSGGLGFGTNHY